MHYRIFTLLLLFSLPTYSTEQAKALHDENCTRCHDQSVYLRDNSILQTFTQLQERVRQCELGAELTWFDEEIEAVTLYLNDEFYHFIEK